jgi:hypothetical protein
MHDFNIGGSASLVEGLRISNGEYIAILEMDDFWHKSNRIQSAVNFLESRNDVFALNDGIRRLVGLNYYSTGVYNNWDGKSLSQKDYNILDWQDCSYPGHISALTFRNFSNNKLYSNFIELIGDCDRNVSDITLVYILLLCGDVICRDHEVSTYRVISSYNKTNYTSQIKGRNANLDRNKHLSRIQNFHFSIFNVDLPINRGTNSVIAESILLLIRYPNLHNFRSLVGLYAFSVNGSKDTMRLFLVVKEMIAIIWRRIFYYKS